MCKILVQKNGPKNSEALTAAFLSALDSEIHNYPRNIWEMTEKEREPYVQDAIAKNPRQSADVIRNMFEKPFKEYEKLNQEQKKEFLLKKLKQFHQLSPEKLSVIIASCE